MNNKIPSLRNKTITLSEQEYELYRTKLLVLEDSSKNKGLTDRIINQDMLEVGLAIPSRSVDLLIVDPPYNVTQKYGSYTFKQMRKYDYKHWLTIRIERLKFLLKPTASIYVCCNWKDSSLVYSILSKYFIVRNRITWEHEKGRGSKTNWKSTSEDIWYATMSNDYTFNVDAVKLKKTVITPYKDAKGKPKDWIDTEGKKTRLTHPSNFWTDISVPFWSMAENTEHPTQKPEKLLAKLILASSNAGDLILDPFAGVGSTLVVAKKLNRNYIGIEIDERYCCLSEKRLAMADTDKIIQGYKDGVFYARNYKG